MFFFFFWNGKNIWNEKLEIVEHLDVLLSLLVRVKVKMKVLAFINAKKVKVKLIFLRTWYNHIEHYNKNVVQKTFKIKIGGCSDDSVIGVNIGWRLKSGTKWKHDDDDFEVAHNARQW